MLNSLSEGMTTLTGIIKPEMTVYVPVRDDTNIIKNLIDGEGIGSVQQNLSEDGKKKGSTAHGKYSAAFNKDNHAYQRSSFAVGGGNQVGMTEEEFNAKYPEGKDSVGSTYEESNSFGFVAGQKNKVHARGAAIPGGYLNVVDGDYSVVLTGDRNTVSARYASILGGAVNDVEVSSDSSTILSGIYNIVGGAYCTVGGIFNVIRSSGTVALGNNLQSDGNHGNKKVLLGSFNNPNSLAFFQLGFGTEDDRKNLVEAFENGVLQYNVTADGSNPYQVANMGAVQAAIQAETEQCVKKGKTVDGLRAVYGRYDDNPEEYAIQTSNEIEMWDIPAYRTRGASYSGDIDTAYVLMTGTPKKPEQCANKKYVDEAMASAGTKLYKHNIVLVGTEERNGIDQRQVEYSISFAQITNDPFSYNLDDIMDRDFQNVIADVMYYDDAEYSNYFYGALPIHFLNTDNIYGVNFNGSGCDDDNRCFGISESVYLESYDSPFGDFGTRVNLILGDIVEEL